MLRLCIRKLFAPDKTSPLEDLEIMGALGAIREEDFRRIFAYGPNLRRIAVTGNPILTGAKVKHMACVELKVLDLTGCEQIETAFLERVVRECPRLERICHPRGFVERLRGGERLGIKT